MNHIGMFGLGVMGRSLALNFADNGYKVSVYNITETQTISLSEQNHEKIFSFFSLHEFIASLEKPRKIFIMIKAGSPVDETIEKILPYLEAGDVLMDGGNSFYEDTIRRESQLKNKGIFYFGVGVSGGETGARFGASIMPGGDEKAYALIKLMLESIAAKVNNEPCCTYIGPNGAGHYVKMVHNGIEYADMQLICEAYELLKRTGLSTEKIANYFDNWNQGELNSFLIEITSKILRVKDEDGIPLVEKIEDIAGQKGTGKWISQEALEIGIPLSMITEAVFIRYLSGFKEQRVKAAKLFYSNSETTLKNKEEFIEAVRKSLYISKICSYAQGFSHLKQISDTYGWGLRLGKIASIFREGCIIRAKFLNEITEAYNKDDALENLIMDDYFSEKIKAYDQSWRRVVSFAIENKISVPVLSSSISYFDAYTSAVLPVNLLQAQRDCFGAHTYRRFDKEGTFHTQWV